MQARTVLEPVWRRWELARVAVLVNGATVLTCVVCLYTLALVLPEISLAYTPWTISGLSAFNAAVFVGVKQV
jgi:hypothetical protein